MKVLVAMVLFVKSKDLKEVIVLTSKTKKCAIMTFLKSWLHKVVILILIKKGATSSTAFPNGS
jgi:hypothetical protein